MSLFECGIHRPTLECCSYEPLDTKVETYAAILEENGPKDKQRVDAGDVYGDNDDGSEQLYGKGASLEMNVCVCSIRHHSKH